MTLLYITADYPSVSETFVVGEAAAVAALGVPVVGYALRKGAATRSAVDMTLVCEPPTRRRLVLAGLAGLPWAIARLWALRRDGLVPAEAARVVLAAAHASCAARACAGKDVTHVHAHFLGRSADVASILAPLLGVAWTVTAHGADVYAPREPGLLRGRLREVAAVACANAGVQRAVRGRAAPGAVHTRVVHCGVDTGSLGLLRARRQPPIPHLVTVGRLVATKGHWTVVAAALALKREGVEFIWTVVGDGPLRHALANDARCEELRGQLRFVGALEHPAVVSLLHGATAFVLPCETAANGDSDGIPVALMEAMAVGIPVVSTSAGGIGELITAWDTGLLIEPRDAAGLVEAIRWLLQPEASRALNHMLVAARNRIESDFDVTREARSLLVLLQPYLSGRGT